MLEVTNQEKTSAAALKIAALTPFTTIDYPGKLSAVVFVRGCPWKCLYCQNPWMQSRISETTDVSWEKVTELLVRRRGLLDGVVFSGGEPCVDPALPEAVKTVKSMGMSVGLHTCGAYPKQLAAIIGDVDWIGLDVKATLESAHYSSVVQAPKALEHFLESFELIRRSGVAYEARTTAHPDYLTPQEILQTAHWLCEHGCKNYALQIFRKAPGVETMLENVVADYPGMKVLDELKSLFTDFKLRRE